VGAAFARAPYRFADKARSDALPPKIRMNAWIEKECMPPAVPGNIDEADDPLATIGSDVGETALQDRREIPLFSIIPCRSPKLVQRGI